MTRTLKKKDIGKGDVKPATPSIKKKGPPRRDPKNPFGNFKIMVDAKMIKIERLIRSIGALRTDLYDSTTEQREEIRKRINTFADEMVTSLGDRKADRLPKALKPETMSKTAIRLAIDKLQEELRKRDQDSKD